MENGGRKKASRFLDYRRTVARLREELDLKEKILNETLAKLEWCEKLNRDQQEIIQRERSQYGKEKMKLCRDIYESQKTIAALKLAPTTANIHVRFIDEIAALQTENQQLRRLIERADLQQHELCVRFMRLKKAKDEIYRKLLDVDEDYIRTLRDVLAKSSADTVTNQQYAETLSSNAALRIQNVNLKMELQCLRRDIDAGLFGNSSEIHRSRSLHCLI